MNDQIFNNYLSKWAFKSMHSLKFHLNDKNKQLALKTEKYQSAQTFCWVLGIKFIIKLCFIIITIQYISKLFFWLPKILWKLECILFIDLVLTFIHLLVPSNLTILNTDTYTLCFIFAFLLFWTINDSNSSLKIKEASFLNNIYLISYIEGSHE